MEPASFTQREALARPRRGVRSPDRFKARYREVTTSSFERAGSWQRSQKLRPEPPARPSEMPKSVHDQAEVGVEKSGSSNVGLFSVGFSAADYDRAGPPDGGRDRLAALPRLPLFTRAAEMFGPMSLFGAERLCPGRVDGMVPVGHDDNGDEPRDILKLPTRAYNRCIGSRRTAVKTANWRDRVTLPDPLIP